MQRALRRPSARDYERLLLFRTALREFARWSEDRAADEGIAPMQHQLLLAIKGHVEGEPTVGDVAAALLLRHHSAGELVDRAVDAGFVLRHRDDADQRVVRLRLSKRGERVLERLTALNLKELARLAPRIHGLLETLER